MVTCIRINIDATMDEVNTSLIDTSKMIEKYFAENGGFLVLVCKNIGEYNKYEFQRCNPKGIVYVYYLDPFDDYVDLYIEDFIEFYEEEIDLDDTIIEDELVKFTDEQYEEDGFIIPDV